MSVFIIAEAGVNHNGSLKLAKKLVDEAKTAGADCIKFQTFISSNIVSKNASKAEYQKKTTESNESQLKMLEKLELSYDDFRELKRYCIQEGIEFLSTAFDMESIEFLNDLGLEKWKIPSGEITNLPYLVKIAKIGNPVILSTGMCTLEEIGEALEVFDKYGVSDITILHCTTEYPTPFEEVNLNAMKLIEDSFNYPVGYSDHTQGIEVAIAAVALGARIIEKHFTLDRCMEGPDHLASIEANELSQLVSSVRNIEKSMGELIKKPTLSELKNIKIVRKSLTANCRIEMGEKFTEDNIAVKRPGTGISPMKIDQVIGKLAKRSFEEDEMIEI